MIHSDLSMAGTHGNVGSPDQICKVGPKSLAYLIQPVSNFQGIESTVTPACSACAVFISYRQSMVP